MGGLIVTLIVGGVAGWLAGVIWKGRGFGLVWNIVIGVIGSFVGSFLLRLIGLHAYGFIGSIIAALVGALVLLAIINKLKS